MEVGGICDQNVLSISESSFHNHKNMMTCIAFLLVTGVSLARGFSVIPGNMKSFQTTRASVFDSLNPNDTTPETVRHQLPSSPAAVLGKPLNDDEKKRNKQLIGMAKSVLFDVLLPGDTVDRAYARFYALETIARMPYFSYLSVLHLYETLGWWRRADYIKMHFAESWNELHHLLIMEELGGSDRWFDRFIAQHAAVFYYWMVVAAYMANPSFAYNLNQAVEEHAYETYAKFITVNEEYLKTLPATEVAKEYYRDGDLYMFDQMHATAKMTEIRRPKCDTLYDVFCNIRDDEMEHVKTMAYLQEEDADLVMADRKVNGLAAVTNVTEVAV